jgi:hypothetical protein
MTAGGGRRETSPRPGDDRHCEHRAPHQPAHRGPQHAREVIQPHDDSRVWRSLPLRGTTRGEAGGVPGSSRLARHSCVAAVPALFMTSI